MSESNESRFEDLFIAVPPTPSSPPAPASPGAEAPAPEPAEALSAQEAQALVADQAPAPQAPLPTPPAPSAPAAPAIQEEEDARYVRPRSSVAEISGTMNDEFAGRARVLDGEDEEHDPTLEVLRAAESGEEMEEDDRTAPETENVFEGLRRNSTQVAARRFHIRRPSLRGMVIGTAILAGAYAYHQSQNGGGAASITAEATQESGFQAVRSLTGVVVRFAEGGTVQAAGPEYERGANLASYMFTQKALETVQDPEARLAILSVMLERAFKQQDVAGVADVLVHLHNLEGADQDERAHMMEEKGYRFMRQAHLSTKTEKAMEWESRANEAKKAAEAHRGERLEGAGWSPEIAAQLKAALEEAARAPVQNRLSTKGHAGYVGLLRQAGEHYNFAVGMSFGAHAAPPSVARR